MVNQAKLAKIKKILAEERRFIKLLKKDSSIVDKKLKEKHRRNLHKQPINITKSLPDIKYQISARSPRECTFLG